MLWLVTKYAVTALLVVVISEVAKRSDKLGSLVAALPTVTVLTLIWLYVEKQPPEKISNHAWYTFWYVLPTLPMFLVFPLLYRHFGFWIALLFSCLLTAGLFAMLAWALNKFGIRLW
jgi:F0F1-type ATP synthase assembly protein I